MTRGSAALIPFNEFSDKFTQYRITSMSMDSFSVHNQNFFKSAKLAVSNKIVEAFISFILMKTV